MLDLPIPTEAMSCIVAVVHLSKLESILFSPLLHDVAEVFDLWIGGVLQHLENLNQPFSLLLSGDNHLENSNGSSTLTLPELWVSVQSLQHVKGLHREIELSHFVTVVGDQT